MIERTQELANIVGGARNLLLVTELIRRRTPSYQHPQLDARAQHLNQLLKEQGIEEVIDIPKNEAYLREQAKQLSQVGYLQGKQTKFGKNP